MCRPATCETCGKATYVGCGRHVESVLAGVPPEKRCACRDASDASAPKAGGGPLSRLFAALNNRDRRTP